MMPPRWTDEDAYFISKSLTLPATANAFFALSTVNSFCRLGNAGNSALPAGADEANGANGTRLAPETAFAPVFAEGFAEEAGTDGFELDGPLGGGNIWGPNIPRRFAPLWIIVANSRIFSSWATPSAREPNFRMVSACMRFTPCETLLKTSLCSENHARMDTWCRWIVAARPRVWYVVMDFPNHRNKRGDIVMNQSQTSALSSALVSMVAKVREDGYEDIADKIRDLLEKQETGDTKVRVAFCGLFSAGKTSLLRVLCQRDDLLTAAVPTTATVAEIELPGTHLICLDTPGVDSTDQSHQAATEAALHRADAIILVMDYQQVESDLNLELAESFAGQDKPFYLVVNQVDKHLEWELPFVEYRRRIEQTFADWDVVYTRIFYTSTRTPNDEGIANLRETLSRLADELNPAQSATLSLSNLMQEYANRRFAAQRQEASSRCREVLLATPYDKSEATSWIVQREAQLSKLTRLLEEKMAELTANKQSFLDSVSRTIDLAQIAPYDTTEKGRRYVESLRDGFKVGWLRSKEATQREREERQKAFLDDLSNRTLQYLVRPVQSLLREASFWPEAVREAWFERVEAVCVDVDENLCVGQVKRGALMSDRYPYQYVKDVVQAIKSALRGKVVAGTEEMFGLSVDSLKKSMHESEEFEKTQAEVVVLRHFVEVAEAEEDEANGWLDVLGHELSPEFEVVGGDARG